MPIEDTQKGLTGYPKDDQDEIYLLLAERQCTLQEKLDVFGPKLHNVPYIMEQLTAIMVEAGEALQETPWKSWKKSQRFHVAAFQEELADIQLFLLNTVNASGLTPVEFLELCKKKQDVNFNRQNTGY